MRLPVGVAHVELVWQGAVAAPRLQGSSPGVSLCPGGRRDCPSGPRTRSRSSPGPPARLGSRSVRQLPDPNRRRGLGRLRITAHRLLRALDSNVPRRRARTRSVRRPGNERRHLRAAQLTGLVPGRAPSSLPRMASLSRRDSWQTRAESPAAQRAERPTPAARRAPPCLRVHSPVPAARGTCQTQGTTEGGRYSRESPAGTPHARTHSVLVAVATGLQ